MLLLVVGTQAYNKSGNLVDQTILLYFEVPDLKLQSIFAYNDLLLYENSGGAFPVSNVRGVLCR